MLRFSPERRVSENSLNQDLENPIHFVFCRKLWDKYICVNAHIFIYLKCQSKCNRSINMSCSEKHMVTVIVFCLFCLLCIYYFCGEKNKKLKPWVSFRLNSSSLHTLPTVPEHDQLDSYSDCQGWTCDPVLANGLQNQEPARALLERNMYLFSSWIA